MVAAESAAPRLAPLANLASLAVQFGLPAVRGTSGRGRRMDYVNLGHTGLKVSRLCLGCMSFGSSKWRSWVLDEDDAKPFFKSALEAGINFFDTADVYSQGESERVTGTALKEYAKRHEVVIATKVNGPMGADANNRGLSRKHILDGDRPKPEAAGRRLRRPLPDPPLRLRDADRGDARGAERRRPGRQGSLHRRKLDVRVAVHEDAGHIKGAWLDAVRLHAAAVQPGLPRGGA